jgi:peptidoglycan hydrolase CwlO-like protein
MSAATAATLATVATIGTVASVAAGALTIASVLTAKKPTAQASGSQTQFSADPDAGIPLVIGRTGNASDIVFRRGWDTADKGDNDRQCFVAVHSLGPIDAIERFTVDKSQVTFNGAGQAIGAFAGFMWMVSQLGATPEPSALSFGAGAGSPPGWTAQHKLSGKAASAWTLRFDTKAKLYQNGPPAPMWTIRGIKAYDPRKDSTYPGGSGPHRMADPSDTAAYDAAVDTWEWTEDPYLIGLRWAHGIWQRDRSVSGSVYQRVMGMGAPWATIDVPAFVEGANVAQANGWRAGGVIYSGDGKWDSMKKILQAGMGEPLTLGARISCLVNAPKVSLATVTVDDLVGPGSVAATQPRRDRINTITPRFRLEENNWQLLPAAPISVPAHVAEDRGKRSRVQDYPFIQQTKQAAVAARYDIENAREFGPISLPLKLVWMGYKPGDCVTAVLPELGLNGQPILLLNRELSPATGIVTMTARSETEGKHPFALGQTTTPPPTPGVSGPPLVPVPGEDAWAIVDSKIEADGATVPALVIAGAVDVATAEAVVIEYRRFQSGQSPDAGWLSAGVFEPTLTRHVITGVESGSTYEAGVSYQRRGVSGSRRIIGPTSTSGTALDFDNVTGPNKPEDGATVGATPEQISLIDQIQQQATAAAAAANAAAAAAAAAQAEIAAIEDAIGDLDLTGLNDQIAALESDLSGAQTNITNLQTQAGQIIASVGQVGTRVDQVESSVSTLNGSVSTLSQTVTNLNGTVSTLSQTVTTQGGQISTIAQSVTTLSGSLSTLTTIVTASSNPNLLPNGGFENGLRGWTGDGNSGAPVGAWGRAVNAAWGNYAYNNAAWTGDGTLQFAVLTSDPVYGFDVGSYLTLAAEGDVHANSSGAQAWLQLIWITSGGNIYDDGPHLAPGTFGFEPTGATRALFKTTKQVPSGATGVRVSLVTYAAPGVTITSMNWRQVKLERGQIATPYSGEATAAQAFTAYSDLNSSFASLSFTVTSQGGSITTLQQSYTSLSGTVATLSQTVTTQGGSISTLQQVQTTQAGTIAQHSIDISTANSGISLNAQAISTVSGDLSSLTATVSTQGSTISQNASAISTLQGNQATLSSTVSAQGSAISVLQTATSTLQGDAATLRTQVQAGGGVNLVKNGGHEKGLDGWWSPDPYGLSTGSNWGNFIYAGGLGPSNAIRYFDTPRFPVDATAQFTASFDFDVWAANNDYFDVRCELLWFGSDGLEISRHYGQNVHGNASRGFWWGNGSQQNRKDVATTATAPSGAVQALLRCVAASPQLGGFGVRQAKVEKGIYATPYTPDAVIIQSFEALSTLDTQYASLSSTVSVLNASVSTNASAISNLQGQIASISSTVSALGGTVSQQSIAIADINGKVSLYWQVVANGPNGEVYVRLVNSAGQSGFYIGTDLYVDGDAFINGTINPEALALDRFVKRKYGAGVGNPSAGQTLLLYAEDIGVTTANGSYLIELDGSFQTTVGRATSTVNGRPYYQNHLDDGGLLVRLSKNGLTIGEVYISANEYIGVTNVSPKLYSVTRNLVFDAPGGGDGSSGNATILIYAIRGNQDTGQVDEGDYYNRNVSATYSNFSITAKTKWTFI